MFQIVLIRPGSTAYDEQGRIQGTLDIPLSAQGSAKVQQLGETLRPLKLSTLFSAPCQSAWQTASMLGQALGIKVKKLDPLRNVDHGLWQGMLVEDVRRKHPRVFKQWQEQPEHICPPEGEMLGEACERIRAALQKLLRKQKAGAIGLVVPEPLATLVRSLLTHSEIGDIWKIGTTCGSWEAISCDAQTLSERGIEVKEEKEVVSDAALPIRLN